MPARSLLVAERPQEKPVEPAMTPPRNVAPVAFGDLGKIDSIAPSSQQGHRFGPAVFGKIPLDGRQYLKYNAAYLMGKTRIDGDSYVGNTFRMQLEYEF